MGLLDNIVGSVLKSAGNSDQGMAIKLITSLIQNSGGIGDFISKLQSSNLASALLSWISTSNDNQSIEGKSIIDVFGSDLITNIAKQAGAQSGDTASNLIAQYLPQFINKITPNGNVEETNSVDLSSIGSILGKFIK